MTKPTESQSPTIDTVEVINLILRHIDHNISAKGRGVLVELAECPDSVESNVNVQDMHCIYPLIISAIEDGKSFVIEDESGKKHKVSISRTLSGDVHKIRGLIEKTL